MIEGVLEGYRDKQVTPNGGTVKLIDDQDVNKLPESAGVLYRFHGNHSNDLTVTDEENSSVGFFVPSGEEWGTGVFRARAQKLFNRVYAGSSTTLNYTVYVVYAPSVDLVNEQWDQVNIKTDDDETQNRIGPTDESPIDDPANDVSGLRGVLGGILTSLGDDESVGAQTDSTQNDNITNFLAGVVNLLSNPLDVSASQVPVDVSAATAQPLDVSSAEVRIDINSQTKTPLNVDDPGVGDEGSVTANKTPGADTNLLNKMGGLLGTIQDAWVSVGNEILQVQEQRAPKYEDPVNEVARVQSRIDEKVSASQTTTDSYSEVTSISLRATSGNTTAPTQSSSAIIIVENVGTSNNSADFSIEGRFNDGTNQSSYARIQEVTAVSDGNADIIQISEVPHDLRVQTKANSAGNQTDVQVFFIALGA